MKKTFLLSICCFVLTFYSLAQNSECTSKYNTAMDYFNKGEYATALVYFKQVKENCGEFRGVSAKIKECEDASNGGNGQGKSGISVGKGNVSFDPQGGTETIKVNSGEASWSYGKAPEWLKLSKSKGRLVIECESNASGKERSADIILSSGEDNNKVFKKIHVTQSNSILSVNMTSLSFSEDGRTHYKIQVNCNDDWDVDIQNCTWVSVKKEADGILVSCEENPYARARQDTISVITSNNEIVTVNITQDPSEPTLEIENNIKVKWNEGERIIEIKTNDPDWMAVRDTGGSWCEVTRGSEHELQLKMEDNVSGEARVVKIKVTAANMDKYITVKQQSQGYGALYEDYFSNMGGTMRLTKVSGGVCGGGIWGLRVSAMMFRWKVVEIDLLNLNTCVSKSFMLKWEPMIRGYLPLQEDNHCWTAYLGVGRGVTFVDIPLKNGYSVDNTKAIFEIGAECKLKLKNFDNLSSRIFFRFDGYASIGVAFDMYEWK